MEKQVGEKDPVLSLSSKVVETYSQEIGVPLRKFAIVCRDDKKIEARLKNKKGVGYQFNIASSLHIELLEGIQRDKLERAKAHPPSINEKRIAHNLFIKFYHAIRALANKIDDNWNDGYCLRVGMDYDDLDIYLFTKDGSQAMELRGPPTEPEPTIKTRRLKDKLTYEL